MKQDTKKLLAVGGAVAIAGYFLLQPSGDGAGFGGGGGMPLLPIISEATPEEISAAAAPVVYNFPEMPAPVWDTEERFDTAAKKAEVAPGGFIGPPVSAMSPIKIVDPAYVGGVLTKKDTARPTPERPVQMSEASIGGFLEFLAPITQLGKGARGRGTLYQDKVDPKGPAKTKKTVSAQSLVSGLTPYRKSGGVTYGPRGRSYNVPGVTYGKTGITYSQPAGPPRPKKYVAPGSPD